MNWTFFFIVYIQTILLVKPNSFINSLKHLYKDIGLSVSLYKQTIETLRLYAFHRRLHSSFPLFRFLKCTKNNKITEIDINGCSYKMFIKITIVQIVQPERNFLNLYYYQFHYFNLIQSHYYYCSKFGLSLESFPLLSFLLSLTFQLPLKRIHFFLPAIIYILCFL